MLRLAPRMRRAVSHAAVLAVVFAAASARAQDDGTGTGTEPQPTAPQPDEPRTVTDRELEEMVDRMASLYGSVAEEPRRFDPGAPDVEKERARARTAEKAWEDSLGALSRTAETYLGSLGADRAPDARVLFWHGFARAHLATRQSVRQAADSWDAAAASLKRYLDVAPDDDPFRATAERHLGRALLAASSRDPARFDPAIVHLRTAVELLQRESRHDEAGRAAYDALTSLLSVGRDAEALALATAIRATEDDFGASTASVRKAAARAATAPGAKLPELPDMVDAEGKPFSFAALRGKPLLLHFFQAGDPTGTPTRHRDAQTVVRPLWDAWHAKGLQVVGVSMDYEIPPERLVEIRRNWQEWGKKEKVAEGTLESVRAWAESQGVAWPWVWDGKWLKNPCSTTLGGVGASGPYIVLVDKAGVVRWRGEPPYDGLKDAVAKLFD